MSADLFCQSKKGRVVAEIAPSFRHFVGKSLPVKLHEI